MRILILSAYFPPYNAIGALRVGKLAKFLLEQGHDVRVVAAEETLPKTAELEIPSERVTFTRWSDINAMLARLAGHKVNSHQQGESVIGPMLGWLGNLYRTLFNLPDSHAGWYFPARRAAEKIIAGWRPDLIYASATPVTGLLVAHHLALRHDIPWVAELRDLWTDNHYYSFPRWRRAIDAFLERRVLSTAAMLVTVSEPLAEILRGKFDRPVLTVMNGFDPADFPADALPPGGDHLNIVYTGMIYPGRRDPGPLFAALNQMGERAKRVRVHFYGRLLPGVQELVDRHGVGDLVEVHPLVPYRDSLRLQAEADVLLLLLWDTPEERGVFTGKLFEYLGARRPILSLGLEKGVAPDMILERGAGAVATDSDAIARVLDQWLDTKASQGRLPAPPAEATRGMTRNEQYALLAPHLAVAASSRPVRQKVIVVTRKLDVGGTERHLLQVMPHIDRARFDVSVVVLRAGGRLEGDMRAAGVPVVAPPSWLPGWGALVWSAVRLTGMMLGSRRAIVHFFLPEAYATGGLCGLMSLHRRMVMSRRSLNLYQKAHPHVARLERFLHGRMRMVAGNSKAVLANLESEGVPADRQVLIYNGIDLKPFEPVPDRDTLRAGLGIAPGELAFVMVANLIPYKGHLDLIEALASATDALPPWRLLLIGRDDGVAPRLKRRSNELGLGERVQLLGERADVPRILGVCDIGILCSHQEGFSNSVLEGMAAGLPMVVSDVGGNPEAVVDGVTGLVVPPHDPKALGAAILALARDPARRAEMGSAGRRRVLETFSHDACITAYHNLYTAIGDDE
ncbi:MAG: glycosyltransferase [Pseudomonadota bacterium]